MTSEERNTNELKEFLLKQFRNGNKWLAFNPFVNQLTKEDVVCFKTLDETGEHCESTFMAFKLLAGAIREINGESRHTLINREKSKEAVAQLPIESHIQGRDLVNDLASGEIQPLIYNRKIDPAFDIPNYYFIQHKQSGSQDNGTGHEWFIMELFDSFKEAESAFREKLNFFRYLWDDNKPDLILVAGLVNQRLRLDMEGMPERNTGILLTTASPLYQVDQQMKLYEVNHWQSPACPVLKQPMLAQFNPRNSTLNFYDGNLRKVQPGASIEFIKIDFYDFQPLKVGDGQKHSIDEEAKQQYSQKMRNYLS